MTQQLALKESILHWEKNLIKAIFNSLDVFDIKSSTCALCNFNKLLPNSILPYCEACPIYKTTKRYSCESTPYTQIAYTLRKPDTAHRKKILVKAIKEEIYFLKSLVEA